MGFFLIFLMVMAPLIVLWIALEIEYRKRMKEREAERANKAARQYIRNKKG